MEDARNDDEPPGAVEQQKSFPTKIDKPRPVLVTSGKSNASLANGKPQTREITSRYKSGITSAGRSPSPNAIRTATTPRASVPHHAQSADRRRPSTPSLPSSRRSAPSSPPSKASPPSTPSSRSSVPSTPTSKASPPSTPLLRSSVPSSPSSRPSTPFSSTSSRPTTPVRESMVERLNSSRRSLVGRDGLWPSMQSLSSSFQSDSSVFGNKRDKVTRNPSPDRTLKSSAGAVAERKRTPLRGRNAADQSENSKPMENSHAKVIDQLRWPGRLGGRVSSNALSKSVDLSDKVSRSSSLPVAARGFSPTRRMLLADSVNKGIQKSTTEAARQFSSDGSERTEHATSLAHSVNSHPPERASSVTRPRSPSPIPSLLRPSSPNKTFTTLCSTPRGALSPSRTRLSTPFSPSSSATSRGGVSSSVFNYIADVRKGRKSANHMEDAHQLRLLYNRDLQWRFVNARTDHACLTQKLAAENILYNVWNVTSELRDSVIFKRIGMQNLRQKMKLGIVLREQLAYLEDWTTLEREHSNCLSGAIEALKASTLRLPVTVGARADVHTVKNAISSAVDVMQAMGSSICCLLSRVEGTNCLVSGLSEVATTERAMLDESRELLASVAAMQVQECSLRTHLIQLGQDVQVE